jgi:hypothetical protein
MTYAAFKECASLTASRSFCIDRCVDNIAPLSDSIAPLSS